MTTKRIQDGDTFRHNGRRYRASVKEDAYCGLPWEEDDGHGEVRADYAHNKAPGEMILGPTGSRDTYYLYDFSGAVKKAHADGWGLCEDALAELRANLGGAEPTAGQIRAAAAMADFRHLRDWVAGDWRYVGIEVAYVEPDGKISDKAVSSLWGVESSDAEHIDETARFLADDCASMLYEELDQLRMRAIDARRKARAAISSMRRMREAGDRGTLEIVSEVLHAALASRQEVIRDIRRIK